MRSNENPYQAPQEKESNPHVGAARGASWAAQLGVGLAMLTAACCWASLGIRWVRGLEEMPVAEVVVYWITAPLGLLLCAIEMRRPPRLLTCIGLALIGSSCGVVAYRLFWLVVH
jgi:hypothetical protein